MGAIIQQLLRFIAGFGVWLGSVCGRVSYTLSWLLILYVAKDNLKFLIHMPSTSLVLGLQTGPTTPIYVALGVKAKALCRLGKCSTS